jgi:hypothetical protein
MAGGKLGPPAITITKYIDRLDRLYLRRWSTPQIDKDGQDTFYETEAIPSPQLTYYSKF